MGTSSMNRRLTIASLALLLGASLAFQPMSAATEVSGAFTVTYSSSVPGGTDSKGASIFVSSASGSNRNTGSGGYLSNARVVNVDTAAMVNGNGSHSGLATFTEGSNTAVKRFTGKVTTVMVGGKPESTFKGTWTAVRGTGKYAGLKGSGTYSGRFNTSKNYTVTWKGGVSM